MTSYILAADGGGTKTHVVCADETGKVVGEGVSGPTSLAATSIGAASFNLKEAVRQATEGLPPETIFSRLVMGLAGMDTKIEQQQAQTVFAEVISHLRLNEFILVNDSLIALESGTTDADAVALIAGTGSNCFGRAASGKTAKTGGMDYLLTDQGSGYAIGRAVLRQALKSYDGRGPKTELEQYVCEHFRISTMDDLKLKVYQPPLSKTEVAELSQVCLRAFDQGDAVAKAIFDHAVDELVLMVKAVLAKLDLSAKPVTCVLAGSITKISYIQDELDKKLAELNPQMKRVVPSQAPVYGALILAKQGVSPQVVPQM